MTELNKKKRKKGPPFQQQPPQKRIKKDKVQKEEGEHHYEDRPNAKELLKYESAMRSKHQLHTMSRKSIKTLDTTPQSRKKVKSEAPKSLRKRLDELEENFKYEEPSDMMRHEEKLQEIEGWAKKARAPLLPLSQEANSLALMPTRERQWDGSLSPQGNVVTYQGMDLVGAIKTWNYERNRDSVDHEEPMEHLIEMTLSSRIMPMTEAMRSIGREFDNDMSFVRETIRKREKQKKLKEERRAGIDAESNWMNSVEGGPLDAATVLALERAKRVDLSSIKLNIVYGSEYYAFNYNKRLTCQQQIEIILEQTQDRDERLRRFYEFDMLDEDVRFGKIMARDSKMFRQLIATNELKYRLKDNILGDAASLVPKVSLEVVTREYITQFRMRPLNGEDLCRNGVKCIFNTLYAGDKNVCYIGKVF
jgi:hypothetical protein